MNCQSPRGRFCLRNFRQLDFDGRAADCDAINQVANAGLRSGAVRGQLAKGISDERFDVSGGNADDRTCFAVVALQDRLRDLVAPAFGSLPRPGRTHSITAIVEKLPGEHRLGRLARSLRPQISQTIAQGFLDLVPQVLGHDRRMLALV